MVCCEQGAGDSIQFGRYVSLLRRKGASVAFEVQDRLQRLMKSLEGPVEVYRRGEALPDFDCWISLLSLPMLFGTDFNTVPDTVPYLSVPGADVEEQRRKWPAEGLRVGLCWAGNSKYKNDKQRSFSLLEFKPLMDLEGVNWFSLQYGVAARQIEKYSTVMNVIDASSNHVDFAESAALIQTLDLVLTSDTSVAHLTGALGKKVWVLLSKIPDWRFGVDTEDYVWYPTMRLFRQASAGDWGGVMCKVREALVAEQE